MEKKYEAPKLFIKIYSLLWKIPFLQYIRIIFYFIDFFILLTIKKPKKNNDKKKVLIIYNVALGDTIMDYQILDSFNKIYYNYEITFICQKANAILLKEKFDNIIEAEFTKASVNLMERRKIFKKVREQYYDIVVDPIGTDVCSPNIFTTRAAVSKKKIGVLFNSKNKQCPKWIRNRVYTDLININVNSKHKIGINAEILRELGDKECIAVPANLPNYECNIKVPNKFFIIYPSASVIAKCWPVERYVKIAEMVYNKTKLPLVVLGTQHDKKNVDEFLNLIDKDIPVINLIEKTGIKEYIEIIGKAEFLITNDTSAYHIGIAKKVKTFILAGGYTFTSFVNYNYSKLGYPNPIIINNKMNCYDCNLKCIHKIKNTYLCIDTISIENAWNIIKNNI